MTCLKLWVSNLTDVSTWRGCVQVAFVIDGFALDRRLARVGHGAPSLRARRIGAVAGRARFHPPGSADSPSDQGLQHGSIRYAERLAEAGHRTPHWIDE